MGDRHGHALTAFEVKSGRASAARSSLQVFSELFKPQRKLLVGADGIALESFLSRPAGFWTKRGHSEGGILCFTVAVRLVLTDALRPRGTDTVAGRLRSTERVGALG